MAGRHYLWWCSPSALNGRTAPQVVTVSVRGTDSAGNTSAPDSIEVAVYDPDEFRMEIWDRITDTVVYHNVLDGSDSATPIEKGRIVIKQ